LITTVASEIRGFVTNKLLVALVTCICIVIGASKLHVMFREILPNCVPSILTKMTLDFGFVILIASSLSFLGLGVQPPTPDLGSMVAEGAKYLPDSWWLTIFPGLAILVAVFGFNLIGDALREILGTEQ